MSELSSLLPRTSLSFLAFDSLFSCPRSPKAGEPLGTISWLLALAKTTDMLHYPLYERTQATLAGLIYFIQFFIYMYVQYKTLIFSIWWKWFACCPLLMSHLHLPLWSLTVKVLQRVWTVPLWISLVFLAWRRNQRWYWGHSWYHRRWKRLVNQQGCTCWERTSCWHPPWDI